jgi:hypothetical protein
VLHPNLVVLKAPPNDRSPHIHIRPAQRPNGANPMAGLMREHERQPKPRRHLIGNLQQRAVLLIGEHRPPWRVLP